MDADQILDRGFLEVRARLLELAAHLDRLDRAPGSVADDPRLKKIHQGLALLSENRDDRAEQLQLLFSRSYDPGWRQKFLPAAVSSDD